MAIQTTLEDVRAGRCIQNSAIVWPAGLDRSIAISLPLNKRTSNCLKSAQSMMMGDGCLLAGELLKLPNFGAKCLKELLFAVETYLLENGQNLRASTLQGHTWLYLLFCARELSQVVARTTYDPMQINVEYFQTTIDDEIAKAIRTDIEKQQSAQAIWQEIQHALNPVIAVMVELGLVTKLSDVLNTELLDAASILRKSADLDRIRLIEVVEVAPSLVNLVIERLEQRIQGMSERELVIFKNRILQNPLKTLESIGSDIGITRERVRQIQTRLERNIEHDLGEELKSLASILKSNFAAIVSKAEMTQRMDAICALNKELAGDLLRDRLTLAMDYELDGEMFISVDAKAAFSIIREIAATYADMEGLIDEETLSAEISELHPEFTEHWGWLMSRIGLHRLHGQLALRNSAKARAKAALISIGRPATKREIGQLCGMTAIQVGGAFSNIPSVVRADLEHWGLAEWVDDEYEGISAEIIQRIKEDGGTTTTERLLTELPEKFGVSPASVRAYMQAQRFVINDGWISLASKSSIRLRDLEDVIDGRDDSGAPYWTFAVESRYFNGYSVTNVPPEFAKALGCEPDSSASIRIGNLPNFRDLSINWSLASITGASLGYTGRPLEQLGLKSGDRARLIISSCP